MKIITTMNHLPFSVGLRYFTGEKSSHLAVVFDDKLVVQSNFLNQTLAYYPTFLKHQTLVEEANYKFTKSLEEEIYLELMDTLGEVEYDYKALLFDCVMYIANKIIKTPLPKKNPLNDKNKYLCIEIACALDRVLKKKTGVGIGIPEDVSLLTPDKCMILIKGAL
jgi:hypothetical protein